MVIFAIIERSYSRVQATCNERKITPEGVILFYYYDRVLQQLDHLFIYKRTQAYK